MKIFLSSAENDAGKRIFTNINEPHNVLVSYYYLRGKTDAYIKDFLDKFKAQNHFIMLDSGAHTFLNEQDTANGRKGFPQKKTTKTKETPEQYVDKYFIFLRKWKDYFDIVVELDIDAIVGYPKVLQWRREFYKIIPKEKLVLVWHHTIPNWQAEWERWAKEGCFLGIGSFPSKEIHKFLFNIAMKYNAKVHGFAMTKTWWMLNFPWYSVDSSSWNLGSRFGNLMYFDNKDYTVKTFSLRDIRTNPKALEKFRKEVYPKISRYVSIPFSEFVNDRSKVLHLDKANVQAYKAQETAITSLWKARGIIYP